MQWFRRKQRDRRELGFFDHLDELRMRLIRIVCYVCAGGVAGWHYRVGILSLLRQPAEVAAEAVGVETLPFRVFEPAAGFSIAIQVALLAGVILASPLIIWEIWRFIEPALENNERRYAVVVLPFAVGLFLGGVVFCYYVSPRALEFLFRIDMSLGAEIERTLKPYLWFMMRLLIAFGLSFELPLVLMFLGFIGVVNSRQLLSWWRHAIVIIFCFAAIVTPTVDPVNMTVLAGPMVLLYLLSIVLVRMVQKAKERQAARDEAAGMGPVTPVDYSASDQETEAFYTGDMGDDGYTDEHVDEYTDAEDTEDFEIPGPRDEDVIDAEFSAPDETADTGDEAPVDEADEDESADDEGADEGSTDGADADRPDETDEPEETP